MYIIDNNTQQFFDVQEKDGIRFNHWHFLIQVMHTRTTDVKSSVVSVTKDNNILRSSSDVSVDFARPLGKGLRVADV